MAGNQKLNATITIGGAVSASLSKAVGSANAKLSSIGAGFGGSFAQRQASIGAAIERNAAALDNARTGLFDAVGAYYALKGALGAPIQAAADFETALEDIGQKAGIPQEKLGALGEQIKQVARDTNQAASTIGGAVDALVGRGASVEVALAAADPIGKAATAYRAATDDLAAASWSAVDNLKVPASEIESALDAMAQAGKEGAFELRDMATYFPKLGAAYQALGQDGVDAVADLAAALQVVRKGTGDASGAATNLQGVLQKIYAPATVKKFADKGVDVFAEMEKAAQRGLTPIEAIAELTDKTLGGDLSKLGQLFEDAETQAGLRSIIQGIDEYRRIRDEALGATGVVQADYQRRIRTAAGATARWNASLENLSITFGAALLPALNDLLDAIIPVIGKVGEWIEANPELVSQIALAVGGLVAFKGALAAIRFVGLLGQGGALNLLALGMATVGRAALGASKAARGAMAMRELAGAIGGTNVGAIQKVGAALYGMAAAVPGMTMLGQALGAIGAAVAGIGAGTLAAFAAVAALVAAAGFSIWKYWDRVSSVFSGVAKRVGEEFQPALEAVRPVLDWLQPIGDKIAGAWERVGGAFEKVKAAVTSLDFGGLFSQEVLTPEQIANGEKAGYKFADMVIKGIKAPFLKVEEFKAIGGKILQNLWDGMAAKFGEFITWVKSIPGQIVAAIGNVDLSNVISFPSFGSGGGNGAPAAKNNDGESSWRSWVPGFAVGGSFQKGPIRVGEMGEELLFADRAGFIATNRQLERMRGAAEIVSRAAAPQFARAPAAAAPRVNLGGITINAAAGMDPRRIADEVMRTIEARMRGVLYDGGR